MELFCMFSYLIKLVWNKVLFFRCITNGRPAAAITIASFTSIYSFWNSINDNVGF